MSRSPIADALDRLSRTIDANPVMARSKPDPATAMMLGGLKCRVTGRSGREIETDMPPAMGGAASCPTPGWFFRASLAACCSTVIAAQAARRGITLSRLEVTVESESDVRGMLGVEGISAGHAAIRTSVRISAENRAAAELQELVRWAAEHSPVGCTIRDAPENALSVVVV